MIYDVVPIKGRYRGMGRLLSGVPYTKRTKKEYYGLLNMYLDYLTELEQEPSKEGLIKLINFCDELLGREINCEVIAYEEHPIENAFGYALELLGIDIVHDMCESLLSECVEYKVLQVLNENELCVSEEDVLKLVPLLDHGGVEWRPCYVYKVLYDV